MELDNQTGPPPGTTGPGRPARVPLRPIALVLALIAAATGILGLATADDGLERRSAVVAGVPVEVARPARTTGRLPGIVVAHGLGASRQLMRGFADTLARRGYAVELVDLAGHGASTERLPGTGEGPAADARLDHDLDVAVGHLRALPWVDGGRIGLLGHSMGAAAVLRYAAAHADVRATVAISQGAMAVPGSASRPRDLLLLAGGLEFPGYRDGAVAALRAAYPQGRAGVTYGDPRAGTARRAVLVGGVEHVSILFAPQTHREVVSWLDAGFGRPAARGGVGLRPVRRVASAMLLHLAAVLSFGAIASALLGRMPPPGRERRPVPLPVALGVPALAVAVALPAMAALPRNLLPLAVAGPLAGFFGVIGAAILLGLRLAGRSGGRRDGTRPATAAAAVILAAWTVLSFAVPAQLGWAHAVPVGPRVWALIPVTACAALFFGGVEALCAGYGRRAATMIHAWTTAGALAGLCLAVFLGAAPPFVLLVAPLLAALLVWQGVQAAALRAVRAPAWVTAVVGGVLLGWPLAVTMPIG
ncbi:dienelactone hydrolase family protein [Actinoallomurus rhizosphaericola]|uniref:dienelactone hydrolase family protein n=1 Tax=Actinoallomurus rhizosphaericola TaxID=2952536 RepID=UPI002093DE99|nr:alpha/beta fold hydrolase [Actinoallomurus rhizosphaericola]MCO6000027.1 alpha/beta fold hydrolase [Actinoallomurus rhizosphaericola]